MDIDDEQNLKKTDPSKSIVFDGERVGGRLVNPNDLGEEITRDLRDAYALAFQISPDLAGVIFAELREIRRDRVKMEYRLGLWEFVRDESEVWMIEQGAEGWVFAGLLDEGILLEREVRRA